MYIDQFWIILFGLTILTFASKQFLDGYGSESRTITYTICECCKEKLHQGPYR